MAVYGCSPTSVCCELPHYAQFMRVALDEARKGLGRTGPNPVVGAVLVSGGRIVARGHHARAGGPHAEIACLRKLGQRVPRDATFYVTLEPCSTTGKTPPCVKALIDAGVRTIVIGAIDVNPRHRGRGISELRNAGVTVHTGVLASESLRLNEGFNKWIISREPFVIAKCAMSLDGRLTRPPGESRWLTSPRARAHARRLRGQVDAVLVGAETIRHDNPQLTVRSGPAGRRPWRVILTRSGRLPRNARVFRDAHRERTLVYRNQTLRAVLRNLGMREVTSVLIEGGGEVLSQALDQRLIDKIQIYLAPIFTGGNVLAFAGTGANSTVDSLRVMRERYERIAEDICVTGYPASQGQLQHA
jgi:diaminohydroxyphosphoribosylaminopyrimidine deaminase/5-amino-6-(5-phosphoribosylamino)uracil reductase